MTPKEPLNDQTRSQVEKKKQSRGGFTWIDQSDHGRIKDRMVRHRIKSHITSNRQRKPLVPTNGRALSWTKRTVITPSSPQWSPKNPGSRKPQNGNVSRHAPSLPFTKSGSPIRMGQRSDSSLAQLDTSDTRRKLIPDGTSNALTVGTIRRKTSRLHTTEATVASCHSSEAIPIPPTPPHTPECPHYSDDDQTVSATDSDPDFCIGSAFDPFAAFPIRLDKADQTALSAWVELFPERLFGIRKNAPQNPHRDWIFPLCLKYPAVLYWGLVSGSAFSLALGGHSRDHPYIGGIRRKAYRLINNALSDPPEKLSEELTMGITAAIMTESRFQTPEIALAHIDGLRSYLDRYGGVEALAGKPWHVTIVIALTRGGRGFGRIPTWKVAASLEAFLAFLDKVKANSLACHAAHIIYARHVLIADRQTCIHEIDGCEASPEADDGSRLDLADSEPPKTLPPASYLSHRTASFSPGSPLHAILSLYHLTFTHLSPGHQNCHLACLLSLSMALADDDDDYSASIRYLSNLTAVLERNSVFEYELGATSATPETLNWFLCIGGLEGEGRSEGEFWRKWRVVEAMGVVVRLGEETRGWVRDVLYGFLVQSGDGCEDCKREWVQLMERVCERVRGEGMMGQM